MGEMGEEEMLGIILILDNAVVEAATNKFSKNYEAVAHEII